MGAPFTFMQFIPFLVANLAALSIGKTLVRPLTSSAINKGSIVVLCFLYLVEPMIYATIGICSYFLTNQYLENL